MNTKPDVETQVRQEYTGLQGIQHKLKPWTKLNKKQTLEYKYK